MPVEGMSFVTLTSEGQAHLISSETAIFIPSDVNSYITWYCSLLPYIRSCSALLMVSVWLRSTLAEVYSAR